MMRVIRRSVYCFKPIFAGHISRYTLNHPTQNIRVYPRPSVVLYSFSICVHRCPFVVLHFFDAPVSEALWIRPHRGRMGSWGRCHLIARGFSHLPPSPEGTRLGEANVHNRGCGSRRETYLRTGTSPTPRPEGGTSGLKAFSICGFTNGL